MVVTRVPLRWFPGRQHPEVLNVRRIAVPGHLQIILNAEALQPLGINDQRAPAGVSRQLNREQSGHMVCAVTL